MTEKQYRARLQKLMEQSVADQSKHGNWRYVFARPQEIISIYNSLLIVEADCGDGCRDLCHIAGVPDDPAGTHYADYGNTSSIWMHLHHAPLSEMEIGDIFTFGRYAGEDHACMAYNVDDKVNPQVWNMGKQGQPVFTTLQTERNAHVGMTVTLCKLNLPPDPPPTPQELLQAKTGFYSWAAWRLGEGPWKHYGALNATVRPNVPKVISPAWWTRYTQFLLARKKGNKATS